MASRVKDVEATPVFFRPEGAETQVIEEKWRSFGSNETEEERTPCWMIHLSAPLAQRITPPSDVISERLADGSLFLSVTDESFDPDNPRHVESAHRLFGVLDTIQEKKPPEQWRR